MRLLVAFICVSAVAGQRAADLRALYDAHQWFRLREAVRTGNAPVFYVGAVAATFNDVPRAVETLKAAIQNAPASEHAYAAHEFLTYIYWRGGQYRRAMEQLDELEKMKPDAPDVRESKKLFSVLARFPEQVVIARKRSTLRRTAGSQNFSIPVAINAQAAEYMVDTGANWPVISAGQAKKRGLKVAKAGGSFAADSGVYSFQAGDVAVADELRVGGFVLKNVAFLVIADDSFADIPEEQRGVLGLPILLALDRIRWTADGRFEIGGPAVNNTAPNLYFDGAMPVIQVVFGESKLHFALDTGAVRTHLYPRFGREFAALVERSGTRGSTRAHGVGGTFDLASTILPQVRLRAGGFEATLNDAPMIAKEVGSPAHHGNLGMDVLSQARAVTLDFRSMTLTLE